MSKADIAQAQLGQGKTILQWKDETGYSRGAERKPTTWVANINKDIRLSVTCSHLYHKGEWIMHCRPWYDTHPIGLAKDASAKEAQNAALAIVRKKIADLFNAIQSVE